MSPKTRKRLLAGFGAVAAVAIAGFAIAYFTDTGTGSGSATVGNSTAWTVTGSTATGGPLYPDPAADIGTANGNHETATYSVTNGGSGTQHLTSVTVSVADSDGNTWSSQDESSKPACTAADFSIAGQSAGSSYTDTSLAGGYVAGHENTAGSVDIEMIDNGANQDNCQGVTVPLYFSAS